MSLVLHAFKNDTTAEKEYVEFLATADVQLSDYAILDQTFIGEQISNLHKHFYHLPAQILKKGDIVKIITGKGEDKKYYREKIVSVYYKYWNMGSPIWNTKDKIELIKFEYVIKRKV